MEVHRGVNGEVHRGDHWCMEGCTEWYRGAWRYIKGMQGGVQRCIDVSEGCADVHGGAWNGAQMCAE